MNYYSKILQILAENESKLKKKDAKKKTPGDSGKGEDDQDALYGIYLQRVLAGKMAK